MGEFIQLIAGWIETLWPFRIVRQYEQAAYYIGGRFQHLRGPGLYLVIPWFMDHHEASVVPEMIDTGRQDITLRDKTLLSFSASAWVRVVDLDKAINTVDEYARMVNELVRSVLADKLASVEPTRLLPESRLRLQGDLARWANEEAQEFGMEVSKVRFTSFVVNPRTYRMLGSTDWH